MMLVEIYFSILTYKVTEAGKRVVEVEARNTSQICSNFGELRKEKLKLSQRKFSCFQCNYQENRDINAAHNVLIRAERVGSTLQGAVLLEAAKN